MKFIRVMNLKVEKDVKSGKARLVAPSQMDADSKIFFKALEKYFISLTPVSAHVVSRLDWSVLTPFQREVYIETLKIGVGKTKTYGELAQALRDRGVAAAPRAVGQALRRNPYPVLIPCHRVVGKAALGGYCGDNQSWKVWLLKHEGVSI